MVPRRAALVALRRLVTWASSPAAPPETIDLRDAYRDLGAIVRRHRKVLI